MERTLAAIVGLCLACVASAQMPKLDDLMKGMGGMTQGSSIGAPDERTNVAGIKEALAVGTENAVRNVSRPDGYFANQAIKILMPSSIQRVAEVLRMAGFQRQVDEFVLSMNRAAEAAAPQAAKFFGDAIREMSVEDVRGILTGGDTAATEFFRRKTQDKLYAAFKPVVSQKVGEVGATKAYKDMMGSYETLPLGGRSSLDLDHYVTTKALDGLFHVVGEEEKAIRTNPAARTTDLLRTVFGR
jgi:hypothetical protein